MSATSATSSSTSTTSSTSAVVKETKKERKGGEGEGQVAAVSQKALSQMAQQIIQNNTTCWIDMVGNEVGIDKTAPGALAMQVPAIPKGVDLGPLRLSKEHLALLNQEIFPRWALISSICLLELWGLDLYMKLEEIKRKVPASLSNDWIEKTLRTFYLGYLSIFCTKDMRSAAVGVPFIFHDRVRDKRKSHLFTREEWARRLSDLNREIAVHAKEFPLLEGVRSRLLLGVSLLTLPNADDFLHWQTLAALHTYFPGADALNCDSIEKTQRDLVSYIQFITRGVGCAAKTLGFEYALPETLPKKVLATFAEQGDLGERIKRLKKWMCDQSVANEEIQEKQAKISRAEISGVAKNSEGIRVASHSKVAKIGAVNTNFYCAQLFGIFMKDFVTILDERILKLHSSGEYAEYYLAHNRALVVFPPCFKYLRGGEPLCISLPTAYEPPVSCDGTALKALFSSLQKRVRELLVQIAQLDQRVSACNQIFQDLEKRTEGLPLTAYLPLWKSAAPYFPPSAIEKNSDMLNALRKEMHAMVVDFVPSNSTDPDIQEKWVDFFQKLAFELSLDIVYYSMLCQDIPALCVMHIDPKSHSLEKLFPDALIDFMNCEGLSGLLTGGGKSSQEEARQETKEEQKPEQKGSEASAASARQTTTTSSVSQQQAQSTSHSSSTLSPLELRRLRKRDELINVLQKMGLTKEEGAKHTKMRDSEGNVVTIISRGSSDIPKGTMQSITQQVLQHVSQTSASQVSSTKSTTS